MSEYEIIRSRRKSLGLEVKRDGHVLVRAPLWMPKAAIHAFVERNRAWIETRLRRLEAARAAAPEIETFSEEELRRLTVQARRQITARVSYFAPLVGARYGRLAIRRQRSRWGSCSSRGNLNFNCLLALVPAEVLDYVVVHELCHLKEMNHSTRFWAEVRRVLPDYEKSRRWLRENGGSLLARLPGR